MALIKCNECGKDVSDKASTCPNCGAPIKLEEIYNDEEKEIITVYCSKVAMIVIGLFFIGVGIYISILLKSFLEYIEVKSGILFLIPLFIFLIPTAIIMYSFLKIKITLTNKRIIGKWAYGINRIDIDYPIRQIKNVSSFGIFGISHFRISDGHTIFQVPFAVNGSKFKKEFFNLIEDKYKY